VTETRRCVNGERARFEILAPDYVIHLIDGGEGEIVDPPRDAAARDS